MKRIMMAAAVAALGLIGALRVAQAGAQATADCCAEGGACCVAGAACCVGAAK